MKLFLLGIHLNWWWVARGWGGGTGNTRVELAGQVEEKGSQREVDGGVRVTGGSES